MTSDSVWGIPGQQRVAEVLRGACARGEVSHALAFIGPSGVGQEHAAHALTAALNCPTPRDPAAPGEPCGRCSVCERAMRGSFSAYQEFLPSGGLHRVDDVRDSWLHAASVSLAEGAWKILRIVDADRMNESAANAFLKGLEEPPERTIWILDIADPEELPDTILSRCRVLRFSAWGPAELDARARALGITDDEDRRIAVRIASGAPAVLARLARPGTPEKGKKPGLPSGMDDVRRHREILQGLREGGPGVALVAAHAIEEEVKREVGRIEDEGAAELAELTTKFGDELPPSLEKQQKERVARRAREARVATAQAALDDLVGWCRDVLLVACGGDPADALHLDAGAQLAADAEALGAPGVIRAIDLALATREDLERNVQLKVALEALFLDLSTLTLAPVGR